MKAFLIKLKASTSSLQLGLYPRKRAFLIKLQAFNFMKVAGSEGFILSNVPGFLAFVKLLTPTYKTVPF